MTKSFVSHRKAAFCIYFENGNSISTVFGPGSYSENHDMDFALAREYTETIKSNTVEIMLDCPDKLLRKIGNKYNREGENPMGHLTLIEWLEIVNMLK